MTVGPTCRIVSPGPTADPEPGAAGAPAPPEVLVTCTKGAAASVVVERRPVGDRDSEQSLGLRAAVDRPGILVATIQF